MSTSVGIQGLESWAGEAIAIADDAEAFAVAIVSLLRNPVRRQEHEAAALRLAGKHFGVQRELEPEFAAILGRRQQLPARRPATQREQVLK